MTVIRSASRSASSRYCVVSSTVVPSATTRRTASQTSARPRGSSPVVGSSRKSTAGRVMRRGGDVEPAPHAAGVRRHLAVRRVGDVHRLEQLGGARLRLRRSRGRAGGRTSRGSRVRGGSRRAQPTARPGRSPSAPARARCGRRTRRRGPRPRRCGSAWRRCGRPCSCRRRSARGARAPSRPTRRGRSRRGRTCRRTSCAVRGLRWVVGVTSVPPIRTVYGVERTNGSICSVRRTKKLGWARARPRSRAPAAVAAQHPEP